MGSNGNGHTDLVENLPKSLRPEYAPHEHDEDETGPETILGDAIETSNPGIRLIANDDTLINMLKVVYVEDYELARNAAEALAECDEFMMEPDPNKPDKMRVNKEVKQRVEWIKYLLSIFCSVKGRFADAYKQAATGILTNSMTERGWERIQMPMAGDRFNKNEQQNGTNKNKF